MIVTPRTGETWLSRSTGEPVTITDSYATAIIGARVAHADAAGHRQNDGLISFRARYVPAVTRPHPLDRAIDGAIKTDLGLGVRTDQPDRMRLAVLTWCASIASSGGDIDDLIGVAAWAAAWVAALDLAGLPAATDAARRVHREEVLIYDCQVEYDRAAAKRLRPAWEAWQSRGRIDGPGRARHEAAHAVVARALGHTVTCADIRHAGDRSGRVEFVPPLPSRGMGPDLWDELTIAMAGSALDLAEGRHHAGSRDDIQLAEATAAALISTGHTPEGADGPLGTIARATAAARARAARILTDHRDQVDVLAAALIRRRRLTGRQIHDLLQHRPEKK